MILIGVITTVTSAAYLSEPHKELCPTLVSLALQIAFLHAIPHLI
jgi:hypothetical protein